MENVSVLQVNKGDVIVVYVDTSTDELVELGSNMVRKFIQTYPDNKVVGLPMNLTFVEVSDKELVKQSLLNAIEFLDSKE